MNQSSDRWIAAGAYDHFMGRWSRRLAHEFVEWLAMSSSGNWLEVGCGTGALTHAICVTAHPASVAACDPSEQFVSFARRTVIHPAVTFRVAASDDLLHHDNGFDAVVSGLVLNFLPDPADAVRTMRSRLRPGGTLAGYVWDYADGMQFLRVFWDAAVALDPDASELDEGRRFPLCRREALIDLFRHAGLASVEARALNIDTLFPDFESYWSPFLGGTGPAPSYVASLDPGAREELRLRLRKRLAPTDRGPIQLTARAWAVRGTVGADSTVRAA